MAHVTCPLCGGASDGPSWLGATRFEGTTYTYLRCAACHSLFCDPMPDDAALSSMYGPEYVQDAEGGDPSASSKDLMPLLRVLDATPVGSFVDYGCGAHGSLLALVAARHWSAIGVEYDDEVAAAAALASGCEVITRDAAHRRSGIADVLHLGDVVEHLTDPLSELRTILDLVRPGGIVTAQGPLEAQANLFTGVLATARRLRGRPVVEMPPYHVLLATTRGQRALFRRAGLVERSFTTSEVAWPAPTTREDAHNARGLALWGLRRASMLVSDLSRQRLGNRYDYVGGVAVT